MATIHYVRHQANGVVWEHPFAQPPTDEQIEAVARLCAQRWGYIHKKTEAIYAIWSIEVPLLGPSDLPDVPAQGLSVVNEATVGELSVTATGTVTPPKER